MAAMHRRETWAVAVVLGLLLALAGVPGVPGARAALPASVDGKTLPSLADMVERVVPAVVNIATSSRIQIPEHPLLSDPFFRRFFDLPQQRQRHKEQKSLGSGVVVDAKRGIILTNHHVIDKADEITVTLRDGRSVKATLVGVDAETDVAAVRVKTDRLQALPLGDSDALRVGDFVVAVGNPFGLGQTVTSGIVSALGRKGLGIKGYEDFIQTDASINPGNSGGALVNLRGELVGVNTAILARGGGNVGIGFAIPVNMAQRILAQLLEYGEVRRGLLGIQAQDLTPELAAAFRDAVAAGAVVTRVTPGSTAAKAGLRSGDIIVSANGHEVADATDLRNVIGLSRVGEEVRLEFVREGRKRQVKAVVAEPARLRMDGGRIDKRLEGAVLESDESQDQTPGIGIISVKPRSTAARTGLNVGDRILSVNRVKVVTFEDLTRAVRRDKKQMLLNIQRGDEGFFILVR